MTRQSISRRSILTGAATFAAWAAVPKLAAAGGGRDPRLLVVVLRGALDGLAVAAPLDDPGYASLRGDLALTETLPLDGRFGLNPRMPTFARLYGQGQALLVHAVATPYRERSHFDGQDVLESGYPSRGLVKSGWLNRALGPLEGSRDVSVPSAVAIDDRVPLVLRGSEMGVANWNIDGLRPAQASTRMRLLDLYEATDPPLAEALSAGIELERVAANEGTVPSDKEESIFVRQAKAAAQFMAAPDGPRIGVLSFNGWDTHRDEWPVANRGLGRSLADLDRAFAALEAGLVDQWRQSAVLVVTEFGRTVRMNGSAGSDHGTGTVAFLFGGAVSGGKVVADWPGLQEAQLYENRDLRPTTDLRGLCKGVLRDHLGLTKAELAEVVFPESQGVGPVDGLIL